MEKLDLLKKELSSVTKELARLQKQYDANEKRINRYCDLLVRAENKLNCVNLYTKADKTLRARMRELRKESTKVFRLRDVLEKEMSVLDRKERKLRIKAKRVGDMYLVNFFKSQKPEQARLYRVSHEFHALAEKQLQH